MLCVWRADKTRLSDGNEQGRKGSYLRTMQETLEKVESRADGATDRKRGRVMTNVDSQRIKEIRDNTRDMAEAFSSIASTLADALELYISTRTETQTETQNSNLTFKTLEYCDICDHKGCDECIANALDEHCMPSQFKKQIEDECAKEYEELGLKELKELIEADRKTDKESE